MVLSEQEIQQAADWLFTEIDRQQDFKTLPEKLRPANIPEAYKIQDRLQQNFMAAGAGQIAGWKIALTTPTMQKFVGVDHPIAGAIFSSRVHQSPAAISADNYVNLGIESEIAVLLGADLPADSAPFDRDKVAKAVAGLMPSTELVDDRNWDYDNPDAIMLVATNAFNAGCIIGEVNRDWQALDLEALEGAMICNGEEVSRGRGADVLGHPLNALTWLANHLAERGVGLQAGQIVMTGSVVKTAWPKPGDHQISRMDHLGDAEMKFTE